MKAKKRQKLCYNCEGDVDLDVIVCPFCAADLREEKPELSRSSFSPAVTSVKQLHGEALYPSAAVPQQEAVVEEKYEEPLPKEAALQENSSWSSSPALALLLFTLGVQLFLLGVLFILFSDRGVMILKWDATYWFLYILASIPLLLFGYRFLNRL